MGGNNNTMGRALDPGCMHKGRRARNGPLEQECQPLLHTRTHTAHKATPINARAFTNR